MKFDNINESTQQCAEKNVGFRLIDPNSFVSKSSDAPATDELCARSIKAGERCSVRGVKSRKFAAEWEVCALLVVVCVHKQHVSALCLLSWIFRWKSSCKLLRLNVKHKEATYWSCNLSIDVLCCKVGLLLLKLYFVFVCDASSRVDELSCFCKLTTSLEICHYNQ